MRNDEGIVSTTHVPIYIFDFPARDSCRRWAGKSSCREVTRGRPIRAAPAPSRKATKVYTHFL